MGSHLFVFYAWLLLLFIVGHVVSRLIARAPTAGFYVSFLRNTFTGYVVVILVHSIVRTEFKTINVVLLLIGILLCFEVRKNEFLQNNTKEFTWEQFATVLVVAALLFLVPWLSISNGNSYLEFYYNQTDYILYSRIAESVSIHGHENGFTILNQLDPYYNNPEPYHFFDVWGAATVSRLFSVNAFPALVTVVYPTFYVMTFAGYVALFTEKKWWIPVAAFGFLFVGGVAMTFIHTHNFFQSLTNLAYTLCSPKIYKLSYFYVFLVSAYLVYRSGALVASTLVCVGLPIANIITLPSIVPGLIIFLFWLYVYSSVNRKALVKSLVYTTVVTVAILGFYLFNQRASAGLAGAEITKPVELLKGLAQLTHLSTQRNIIIGGLFSVCIIYFPYIVIVVLNRKRFSVKVTVIFPVAVTIISLLVWAILFQELNSSQIFSNITIVIINISLAIFMAGIVDSYILARPSSAVLVASVSTFAVVLFLQIERDFSKVRATQFAAHSEQYLKSVQDMIPPNTLLASIRSRSEMATPFMKYNAVYTAGDYLLLQSKGCFTVNVSDLSTPIDSTSAMSIDRSRKAIRDGIFYRFAKRPGNENIREDILIEAFLDEQNIRFIIVQKDAHLPPNLQRRVKAILTDPLSQERLVELEPGGA